MELLTGTSDVLDDSCAPRSRQAVKKVEDQIRRPRIRGSLDDDTLERPRREWGVQSVHESAAIEGNRLTLRETEIAIIRSAMVMVARPGPFSISR